MIVSNVESFCNQIISGNKGQRIAWNVRQNSLGLMHSIFTTITSLDDEPKIVELPSSDEDQIPDPPLPPSRPRQPQHKTKSEGR